jgi:phage shock protein E
LKTLPASALRLFLTAILGLAAITVGMAAVPAVSPEEAARLVSEGKALLIDVREPSEWSETGVAAPAALLSKSDFEGARKDWAPFLEGVGDKQVILYCRSGRRSESVAAVLAKEGFKVANAGGFPAWKDAGLPTRSAGPPAASN